MKNNYKMLVFSVLIVIIIIVSGFGVIKYLTNTTRVLSDQLKITQVYVENQNWNKAYNSITLLQNNWNKKSTTWALFINHHEIDEISAHLRSAKEYIKYHQQADSIAYLATLDHYIEHIPQIKKVTFENIF